MTPYWAHAPFAAAVGCRVPGAEQIVEVGGFPLAVVARSGGARHLAALPGFCSPATPADARSWVEAVAAEAPALGAGTAFLQTRVAHEGLQDVAAASSHLALVEHRTRVEVVLGHEDEVLARCRRDTRSRLRKLAGRVESVLAPEPAFAGLYAEIADHVGMGPTYRYDADDLAAMSSAPSSWEVAVHLDGRYVGGAMLGGVDAEVVDYIVSAYDRAEPEAGRAVLWGSLRAARALGFGVVNLGGGVDEGDSLESYKRSFGGEPVAFATIKLLLDPGAAGPEVTRPDQLRGRFPPD